MSVRTMSAMRILVVDDEPAVRDSLRRALNLEGYEVELAGDGQEALDHLGGNGVDAVVLDVSMPRLDGLEACRRLRAQGSSLPVLMLTARDEVADRVAGLDAGADDYVVKPFALEELLARLRALLRRTAPDEDGDVLRFADVELDPATREVRRGGDPIELTRTEFSLLELFLLNPRQVLTRSIIFERVWGYDFGFGSNSLDVYIGYLRRKTEQGGKPRLIQTIRGVGYALRRSMSFRARLTLAVALAVAVAVAATSAITYVLVRNELRSQVDDALRERVSDVRLRVVTNPVTGEPQLDLPPERFGGAAGITQLVTGDRESDPRPGRDRRPAR